MINKINIENYEEFYLDYLEDNLSDEDKNSFLFFLEENPELKLIDEDIILAFEPDNNTSKLSDTFKRNLKMFDENDEILPSNIEQFIISYYEKCLNNSQKNKLFDFLNNNPSYYNTFKIYEKTFIKPDTIIFPNKHKLKQKKTQYFYYYLGSSAAIFLIMIILYPFTTKNFKSESLSDLYIKEKNSINLLEKNKIQKNIFVKLNKNKEIHTKPIKIVLNLKETEKEKNSNKQLVDNLPSRKIGITELELIEINTNKLLNSENTFNKDINQLENINNEKEYNKYLSVNEMNEPLKFITKPINEKFNSNIELRTAKSTVNKQGGYFFKFGNFEITRKKSSLNYDVAIEQN